MKTTEQLLIEQVEFMYYEGIEVAIFEPTGQLLQVIGNGTYILD